jgi:hypothetical protein
MNRVTGACGQDQGLAQEGAVGGEVESQALAPGTGKVAMCYLQRQLMWAESSLLGPRSR